MCLVAKVAVGTGGPVEDPRALQVGKQLADQGDCIPLSIFHLFLLLAQKSKKAVNATARNSSAPPKNALHLRYKGSLGFCGLVWASKLPV